MIKVSRQVSPIVGVYALSWPDDTVYIGQSKDIKERFKQHRAQMVGQNHYNKKVQEKYNTLGLPEFVILQEGKFRDLNFLEVAWCKEFDNLLSVKPTSIQLNTANIRWTQSEDKILANNYYLLEESQLMKLLPNRTYHGAKARVARLKKRSYRIKKG